MSGDGSAELGVDLDEIRRVARAARKAVSGERRERAEALIASHLASIVALSRAKLVAAYEAADGEPNVTSTLERLHASGVTVALPLVEDNRMWFRTAIPGGERARGELGIAVPVEGRDLEPGDLDVVLMPLVAFSSTGQRCGRGRGYYDKTFGPLVAAAGESGRRPLLVGVGFEDQRHDELPIRDHDVDLDAMVTEIGVRYFDAA